MAKFGNNRLTVTCRDKKESCFIYSLYYTVLQTWSVFDAPVNCDNTKIIMRFGRCIAKFILYFVSIL